jgi:ferredoxin
MSDQHTAVPRAEVDHHLCMGTSMCTQAAARAFRLNQDGQAEFQGVGLATLDELRDAAMSCPMAAINIVEE